MHSNSRRTGGPGEVMSVNLGNLDNFVNLVTSVTMEPSGLLGAVYWCPNKWEVS